MPRDGYTFTAWELRGLVRDLMVDECDKALAAQDDEALFVVNGTVDADGVLYFWLEPVEKGR